MHKLRVTNGVFWVEIPEADLRVLCGCPADAVKHLIVSGLVAPTERAGVRCETGPNAILLSDLPVQGGTFANLAEFPVLQMLYRQGMMLPGHPNNDGRRPMLIGIGDQRFEIPEAIAWLARRRPKVKLLQKMAAGVLRSRWRRKSSCGPTARTATST